MDAADISRVDAAHIWHPYGAMPSPTQPRVVRGADGVRLTLADGGAVIDGMSSWWAAIHGYRHPVLDAAARDQLESMSHVMFGGLTHEPAARLAQLLVDITPAPLQKVFFCDSGSVSVEVAVKMALQYWRSRGKPERTRLLTWRGGYHGDTFTPMSVCDPEGGMHAMWRRVLAYQVFVPAPPAEFDADYVDSLEAAVVAHRNELAAIIVEPVVQGAGGMRFHDPAYLGELRRICDEHDVLLIFDEIATGFGRTGQLFTTLSNDIEPDILCVGKALTGGFCTLAATLTTRHVAATLEPAAIMHGPTFMANPLACAVAAEATAIVAEGAWETQVPAIEETLTTALKPAHTLPGVSDVRVKGAIGVVEMDHAVDMATTTQAAIDKGVWLRPFGRLIYAMPPFVCTREETERIAAAIVAAARAEGTGDKA